MKKRKELREAVAESANGIKSNIYLGMLLEVSEIFRKYMNDDELSDLQYAQRSVISSILSIKEADKIRDISTFIAYCM